MLAADQIRADVLIVGGGLAALRAAIAAHEAGAKVAIVVKGKLGRSGSSAMTTGGYAAALPESPTGDTPDIHFDDTVRGGSFAGDTRLIRILCDEAVNSMQEMEGFGAEFLKEDSSYVLEPSGEHSHDRTLVPPNHTGGELSLPLARYVRELGVEIVEFAMGLELLVQEERVCGALCLNFKQGELFVVSAGSVILATGGCGTLFNFTSNPRDVTGDGYAMALRAGAELRDMEFIQFYPWRCIDPFDRSRVVFQPSTLALGAQLYNSNGERFMQHYDPERWEATTRDVAARGIFEQIRSGLGIRGGVRVDVSSLSEEEFGQSAPKMLRALKKKGIDFRSYEFIAAPEAHYFMGGVAVDQTAGSSLKGLFAAGEGAGGLQGANRLSNNAVPETQVFGKRAGYAAAELALRDPASEPDRELVIHWQEIFSNVGGTVGSDDALDVKQSRRDLQDQMSLTLGIIRSRKEMERGLDYVRRLRSQLEQQLPADLENLRDWHELRSLCDVGEVCLTAALLRTESRGAHFREDCPRTDVDLKHHSIILTWTEEGELTHKIRCTTSGAHTESDRDENEFSVNGQGES